MDSGMNCPGFAVIFLCFSGNLKLFLFFRGRLIIVELWKKLKKRADIPGFISN